MIFDLTRMTLSNDCGLPQLPPSSRINSYKNKRSGFVNDDSVL